MNKDRVVFNKEQEHEIYVLAYDYFKGLGPDNIRSVTVCGACCDVVCDLYFTRSISGRNELPNGIEDYDIWGSDVHNVLPELSEELKGYGMLVEENGELKCRRMLSELYDNEEEVDEERNKIFQRLIDKTS